MIKSGITTRPVELFDTVQIDMDGKTANLLASALNYMIVTGQINVFVDEEKEALGELNDVMAAVANKYNSEFNDNNEYTGDTQC